MILGTTYTFPGESGKHDDNEKKVCLGRSFVAKVVGVGGVYTNVVECTFCGRELNAFENALVQPPHALSLA
jgi:hypothetical protein